ncbi:MAG: prefoldin subunit alpha [Methanomicrobia archaeon]|nr:prefoldin subunit alpha [Methanomicrobia archaeon]
MKAIEMEESGKDLTEKEREQQAEIQSLLLQLRQYQAQAEQTTQELLFVRQAIAEHDKAIETITQLKKMKAGDELLVPIGANSTIYVTLSSVDKIIVRLGGGVSAERDPDSSVAYLTEKKSELENAQREMTNMLQKIEQEAQGLQARLQELAV